MNRVLVKLDLKSADPIDVLVTATWLVLPIAGETPKTNLETA